MKLEKSCGTIIFNNDKVLLLKQNSGDWSFPKGHVEGNETEIETAIRETYEEASLKVSINKNKRYVISYSPKENIWKDVVYFVVKTNNYDIKIQEKEIKDYKWVPINEVSDYFIYDETKELWNRILNDLGKEK